MKILAVSLESNRILCFQAEDVDLKGLTEKLKSVDSEKELDVFLLQRFAYQIGIKLCHDTSAFGTSLM